MRTSILTMEWRTASTFALLFVVVLSTVTAEPVQFSACNDQEVPANCLVHSVDITPCEEAAAGEPCRIKKGKSAAINFDFTPDVTSNEISSRAYWVGSSMGTMPWLGMETNACLFTTCPMNEGVRATYNYTLKVSKKYSARVYQIQWRLWDEEERMRCCFSTKIRLV